MSNKGSKQTAEPKKEFSQAIQDSREVFNKQREEASCKDAQKRIKKLESAVSLLLGLFIGHLFSELITAVFFH